MRVRMNALNCYVMIVVLSLGLVAGCTSAPHASSAALGSSTTATPTSAAQKVTESPTLPLAVTPTASTPLLTERSSGPPCKGRAIAISASPVEAAMGNVEVTLVFRNVGTTPCTLYGFPGVAALDAGGREVAQAQRTQSGYFAIAPSPYRAVRLLPGGAASAIVAGSDSQPTSSPCPIYPAFLVTPPGTYNSTKVPVSSPNFTRNGFPGCYGLAVQPVVTGTSGGQP